MRTVFLLLFTFFGLLGIATAQPIAWSAGRPLTWDDFQYCKHAERFDAATHGRLIQKFDYCVRDSAHMVVTAVFDPILSWKKNNTLTPSLLKHEQGHFDIIELYARRLRKEIAEEQSERDHHTKEWLTDACHRKMKQIEHCQRRYDRQTRHSRRRAAQRRWDSRILAELAELNDYAI